MDPAVAVDPASRVVHPAVAELPGHLLWRAAARVTATLQSVPEGVDVQALAVLSLLDERRARSQQEVADAVHTSRTTMARVAAQLETDGLLVRRRNPDDRRSYALTRTPAGTRAARRLRGHADRLQRSIVEGFDDARLADFTALLRRVAEPGLSSEVPTRLLEAVGFLLTRIHARMHREASAALAPLDLEPRHLGTMTLLAATGPVSQAELARLLGVSGAAVVQIADSLEQRGVVERRRDAGDRRSQLLHPTPDLPEVLRQARVALAGSAALQPLAVLADDERARLLEHLQRFVVGGARPVQG